MKQTLNDINEVDHIMRDSYPYVINYESHHSYEPVWSVHVRTIQEAREWWKTLTNAEIECRAFHVFENGDVGLILFA